MHIVKGYDPTPPEVRVDPNLRIRAYDILRQKYGSDLTGSRLHFTETPDNDLEVYIVTASGNQRVGIITEYDDFQHRLTGFVPKPYAEKERGRYFPLTRKNLTTAGGMKIKFAEDEAAFREDLKWVERGEQGEEDDAFPQDERRFFGDSVNHPAHYTSHPSGIEAIDVTEHFSFNLGNAIKYIWRHGMKGNPIVDLKKAKFCIEREIARLEKENI